MSPHRPSLLTRSVIGPVETDIPLPNKLFYKRAPLIAKLEELEVGESFQVSGYRRNSNAVRVSAQKAMRESGKVFSVRRDPQSPDDIRVWRIE
jgi:hypothetical protein